MFNLTGTTLGRYRIIERLGRGGMADVYKAVHTRLGTYTAVKVLYSHLVEQEDFLMRFEREAKAAAGLRHPNIVRVFDYDIENEVSYIVMDYVDGGTLKEVITDTHQRGEYLPYADLMHIFRQVASALDYAHRQGMIHRDVKSANILIEKGGNAYLTDFGIAHIVSSTHITSTGSLIGTPVYMSPEQCQGEKATQASDIYSLGMVVFEMLTGVVPFADDTPLAVIHKHLYESLPLPGEYRPDLPPAVEAVVMKALAREPQARHASAGAFLDALAAEVPAGFDPLTVVSPTLKEEAAAPAEPAGQTEIGSQETVADLTPQDFMSPPDFEADVQTAPSGVPAGGQDVLAGESADVPIDPSGVPAGGLDATAGESTDVQIAPSGGDAGGLDKENQQTHPEPERTAETVAFEADLAPPAVEIQPLQAQKIRKKWGTGRILAVAGGGIILLLLLALLSGVFTGGGADDTELCHSPQDCLDTAWHFKEEGAVERVRASLTRMETLIPSGELRAHAYMFCEAGEIYLFLDMPRPARAYFNRCLDTAGDEGLRNYANEMLERME